MSRVRSKDTYPEQVVRRLLTRFGFRYRLQGRNLPGRPDIVFASTQKVIFVHGCFWHRHPGCSNCRWPKTRLDFWKPKLRGNRYRDIRNQRLLSKMGWRFLVIWECELADLDRLAGRLLDFLNEVER